MKKKLVCLMLAALMLVSILPASVFAAEPTRYYDGGGDGESEETAYEISNLAQLEDLAAAVNGTAPYSEPSDMYEVYFKLTDNIGSINGDAVVGLTTPIGSNSNHFSGYFNGAGHQIVLNMTDSSKDCVGLFAGINWDAEVSNTFTAGIVSGHNYVGGLCGLNNDGIIAKCGNSAIINGSDCVGGICGSSISLSDNGKIIECRNNGPICGNDWVGGICGQSTASIKNCCNSGAVNGGSSIGGICGALVYTHGAYMGNGVMFHCSNSALVIGRSLVGGVCGEFSSFSISSCYYDKSIEGTATNAIGSGNGNAWGLSTEQMQGDKGESFSTDKGPGKSLIDLMDLPSIESFDAWVKKTNTNGKGYYPTLNMFSVSMVTEGEGTVTSDWTSVISMDEKLSLTVTPEEGYSLKNLSAIDSDGDPVIIESDNTFIMPAADVIITAEFEKIMPENTEGTASIISIGNIRTAIAILAIGLIGTIVLIMKKKKS